jgi:apolipoprotein N-acyltransferase
VPASAVSHFGQMERVFAVEHGRAVLRLVKTGRTVADRTEILAGLTAGETVVLAPPATLRDGQPVTPQP